MLLMRLLILTICFATASQLLASDLLAIGAVDYTKQIKPILSEKCYPCHGVLKQEADLRLDTRSLMLDGAVFEPGDASGSVLLERVTGDDADRMPPAEDGSALRDEEIRLLRDWIDQGADAPDEAVPAAPTEHWAFQRIERPRDRDASLPDSIDAFLSAMHRHYALKPQPVAPRPLLLRRLYLDLIGLPPTAKQLLDNRPWGVIVDELLGSVHHGERWGRHWMDIWRYTDNFGLGAQLRRSQKHMWRWRDWIVQSLNEDKGYDRMVMEMLAGDELAPDDPDVVIATGFLARNYYLFNRTTWLDDTIEHTSKAFLGLTMNCAKCHDHKYDPLTHVDYYRFRAIFEPHQVRLDPIPGVVDFEIDGLPRVFDDHLTEPTYLHVRGDPKNLDTETLITPGVPAILASFQPPVESVALPLSAYDPGSRDYVGRDRLQHALEALESAQAELESARGTLLETSSDVPRTTSPETTNPENTSQKTTSPASTSSDQTALTVEEAKAAVELADKKLKSATATANVLKTIAAINTARRDGSEFSALVRIAKSQQSEARAIRAEEMRALAQHELNLAQKAKEKVKAAKEKLTQAEKTLAAIDNDQAQYTPIRGARKALESPVHKEEDYPPTYPVTSSGRRLALARWMTARDNPLVARVAVNHVWMRHFGEPMVESVSDFGLRAPKPLHADLLDYLSVEFIESGWSFQHLHRLIVTSNAYRRSSSNLNADPSTLAFDRTNQYYWRSNLRRMESQVVRDSLLTLAQRLDRTVGGPSLKPDKKSTRRSLYFKHSRDDQDKFLTMFDDADLLQCYRRSESIVPQQALALFNSKLSIETSREIASMIATSGETSDSSSFIQLAFFRLLAREPDPDESAECEVFIDELSALLEKKQVALAAIDERVQARLVHALLNHNDFISIR